MALLDKIPGDLELYIGGIFSVRRKQALNQCGITHILSVLRLPLDEELFANFEHKVIEVDDVDDENLLEHFPDANRFIREGLEAGGGVFVHCAMGKSRSAAVVCAYLINRFGISPSEALSQVQEARAICEPNEGFMKQLEIYYEQGAGDDFLKSAGYAKWLSSRELELSRACGQAPEVENIRFEDEHVAESSTADFELRCRRCRRSLATSQYLVKHSNQSTKPPTTCAHYFLDPLSWMRPELEQGKLDGRLECPKCKTNIGKYAWQGMQCSCGGWVVPGISLTKGRVDEVVSRSGAGGAVAAMGIRMPPGVVSGIRKTGPGQGSL